MARKSDEDYQDSFFKNKEELRISEDIWLTSNSPAGTDQRWRKTYGYVTARSHEYLIHLRRGRFLHRSSGQAARCYKWPGDVTVLIPTSLKQLVFEAGQLTKDNIHARIRGFVIYRIADPTKIYHKVSFWNREEGEKKLALIVGEPCRSHTKWLVSNMTMEECIRKRKESIADILVRELKLAITEKGPGVEIETIDIQDVRYGDEDLFASVQGPASEEARKLQELARLDRERQVSSLEVSNQREIAQRRQELELEALANAQELASKRIEQERIEAEERRLVEKIDVEQKSNLLDMEAGASRARQRADIEESLELSRIKETERLRVEEAAAEMRWRIEEGDILLEKKKNDQMIEVLKLRTEIENALTPVAIQKAFITDGIPNIARVIASSLEDANVTLYSTPSSGNSALPFTIVLDEITAVLRESVPQFADLASSPALRLELAKLLENLPNTVSEGGNTSA